MRKTKTKTTRLIVAASDTDPDILYATKFWAPDPFIFLQRNGKRTLVLSDLEIDRGRKQLHLWIGKGRARPLPRGAHAEIRRHGRAHRPRQTGLLPIHR